MWRQSLRSLGRSPGYTAMAVVTLGLIGVAGTSAFSMLYGVLVRPAIVDRAEPVVLIEPRRAPTAGAAGGPLGMSAREFRDWRERSRVFSDLAIFRPALFRVGFDGGSRLLLGTYASDRFFQTLRARMAIGRPPERTREIAISEELWRTRFGGSPGVLDEFLDVDGTPFAVVGVVPAGLRFPGEPAALWAPVDRASEDENRGSRRFTAVGRLMRGTTPARAQADADRVSAALALAYPETNEGVRAEMSTLLKRLTEPVRDVLMLTATAVAVMLLAGAASLANLVTLRNESRAADTATRAALGASPRRRLAEVAAENAPISLGGAGLGWLLWRWTAPAASRNLPAGLAVEEYARTGGSVLFFAVASAGIVMTGALLLSAAASARLRAGAPRTCDAGRGRRTQRLTRLSAVAQVALSVVFVHAALLLNASLQQMRETDIGIANRRVLSTFVDLRDSERLPTPQQAGILQRVVDRVRAAPGVEQAAAAFGVPPDEWRSVFTFDRVDETTGRAVTHVVDLVPAGPGYFEVLGIPLLDGRFFDGRDTPDNEPVLILSAGAARRFFAAERVAGRMLEGSFRRVVGVVGDVRYRGLTEEAQDTLYFPTGQFRVPGAFILADGVGDDLASAAEVARAIRAADPGLPVGESRIVGDPRGDVVALPAVRARAIAGLAVLALVQTVVALYGASAYSCSRRMHEYAVRLALGATRRQIAGTAIKESARQAATGLILGVGAAATIGRSVSGVLQGVEPAGPGAYAIAAAAVAAVAIGAAAGPAWRAAGGDPATAFRAG